MSDDSLEPKVADAWNAVADRARQLRKLGKAAEAEAAADDLLARVRAGTGDTRWWIANALMLKAASANDQGRTQVAISLLDEVTAGDGSDDLPPELEAKLVEAVTVKAVLVERLRGKPAA